MNRLRMKSFDQADGNVAKIATLFPQCVVERLNKNRQPELAIDFEKLREELSKDVLDEGEERYQFTWPEKRKASHLANTPTNKTLRPDVDASVDFWKTKNLYIEGENLNVMKILRENYLGKVKMIYIDPPYNTGKDFIYNDHFSISQEDFEERSGLIDENGNRVVSPMQRNTESDGRFHTKWLNMIYPRLKVARDLLSEDGVIFISIDDAEVENLRKVCDEIFGTQNRLDRGSLVWVNRGSSKGFRKIVKNHEFIIAYGKNESKVISIYGENFPESLGELEHYCFNKPSEKNPFAEVMFPKGCKIEGVSDIKFVGSVGKEVKLEIISGEMVFQNGILQNDVVLRGTFPYINQIKDYFNNKPLGLPTYDSKGQEWLEIFFNSNGLPRYRKARNNEVISSVIDEPSIPNFGSEDIKTLLGAKEIFSYPKPKELVFHLMSYFCPKDAIILDFFSGSATTAHAVMKLNAEDGGNRKFIMVQLPEITNETSEARKAGYENICQIGEERLRRAGRKIKEETGLQGQDLDIGFRVLKLDSSNMEDVFYSPQDFDETQISGLVDNIKSDRTSLDLLFQILPELDIELSAKIEEKEVNGKKVFFVDGTYLIATFDTNVNESVVTEIAKMKPQYFVMRDASAASDNMLDNFEQIFKHYSRETVRKLL